MSALKLLGAQRAGPHDIDFNDWMVAERQAFALRHHRTYFGYLVHSSQIGAEYQQKGMQHDIDAREHI